MSENAEVGKTRSQGWEIGARRTLPISPERAWKLLTTPPGLGYWLGDDMVLPVNKGDIFTTKTGISGEIRSFNEGSLVRLRWQPYEWEAPSTLQLRVLPAKGGATISFHHERLENAEQREKMRVHWSTVLDQLESLI